MNHFDQPSRKVEKLLQRSIQQYEKLLLHAEKLADMVKKADYAEAAGYTKQLERLQAATEEIDDLLLEELERAPGDWEKHALYRRRLEIIQTILAMNTRLMPALTGALAVAREESRKVNRSRSAMAGYTAYHTASRKISSSA